jgi:tartrate dehydrogenase/decarboxylase/D-malate dehydrogenase
VRAIETVLDPDSGAPRTGDLGGRAGTADLGRAIEQALQADSAAR